MRTDKSREKAYQRGRKRVIRALTERWAEHLPGRRIPTTLLRRTEKTEQFRRWIQQIGDDQLSFPELIRRVEVLADGSKVDLLVSELGGDPWAYVCEDCGEDVEPGASPCQACKDFRKGG